MSHRRLVMTEAEHNRIITLCGSHWDLVTLLKSATVVTPASALEIEAARSLVQYQDDTQIDDDALLSQGEDGVWVSAWILVKEEA